jgi:hypothetical protein
MNNNKKRRTSLDTSGIEIDAAVLIEQQVTRAHGLTAQVHVAGMRGLRGVLDLLRTTRGASADGHFADFLNQELDVGRRIYRNETRTKQIQEKHDENRQRKVGKERKQRKK